MQTTKEFWWPITIGVIVTPVFYLLGMLFSAGGYNYGLMIILFPYGMTLRFLTEFLPWFVILAVNLLQFPFYGLMVALAVPTNKIRPIVIALATAHLLFATVCGVARLLD